MSLAIGDLVEVGRYYVLRLVAPGAASGIVLAVYRDARLVEPKQRAICTALQQIIATLPTRSKP